MISIERAYEFRPARSPYQHGLNETPASIRHAWISGIRDRAKLPRLCYCDLSVSRSALRNRRTVGLWREPDQDLAAAEIEHGSFDHRWLSQHQRDRFFVIDAVLVFVRQLAKGGAGAIE